MKKFFATLLAIFAISAFAGSAIAKEVVIMNGCDFPLNFIGLSTTESKEVENLVSAPVAPGAGIQVDLNVVKGIDLTVQDNEGAQLEFSNLDLSSASKITLKADGTADIE